MDLSTIALENKILFESLNAQMEEISQTISLQNTVFVNSIREQAEQVRQIQENVLDTLQVTNESILQAMKGMTTQAVENFQLFAMQVNQSLQSMTKVQQAHVLSDLRDPILVDTLKRYQQSLPKEEPKQERRIVTTEMPGTVTIDGLSLFDIIIDKIGDFSIDTLAFIDNLAGTISDNPTFFMALCSRDAFIISSDGSFTVFDFVANVVITTMLYYKTKNND